MNPKRRSPPGASSRRASYEKGSYRVTSRMPQAQADGKSERSMRFKFFLGVCTVCGNLTDECQCPEAELRAERRQRQHEAWLERRAGKEGQG